MCVVQHLQAGNEMYSDARASRTAESRCSTVSEGKAARQAGSYAGAPAAAAAASASFCRVSIPLRKNSPAR